MPASKNFVFAKFSELFAISLIFTFENIYPSDNFKWQKPFYPLCWNVNENSDVKAAIDRARYQSKKQREKATLRVFSVLFNRPVSPHLMVFFIYRQQRKQKALLVGIHIYSREIASFIEQRTAFTRAQSAILQSRDFYLREQLALKVPYPRS